jgi:hypothetical protein
MNGGPGWFRATRGRVKSPLPLHSGLTLRVQGRSLEPVCRRSSCDAPHGVVRQSGIEPASRGYRPRSLPLRYRRLVRPAGDDPAASRMSGERSTAELKPHEMVRAEDFETPSFRMWAGRSASELSARWCTEGDSNSHEHRSERWASASWAIGAAEDRNANENENGAPARN